MAEKSPRVLVVEDDPDIQTTLSDLFEREGYAVDVVHNGAEAITYLDENEHPNVVLVDLLMPGIVGGSLLEYMTTDEQLASIPVAIVSASPQLAPQGYKVFRKPIDVGPLLEFVREGVTRGAK
jgi:CheY-like chemotaxis protein